MNALTPRGWRGRGGGRSRYVEAPPEWRGTSVQLCGGFWPFGAGSGVPSIGVPVGRDLFAGASVCCDPLSYFSRAGLIANPSELVIGVPGLGKSSFVARQCLGLAGYGVLPLVLGDLKGEYVDLIRALGGNVVQLGRGQGTLNVLDPGSAVAAAHRLTGTARRQLVADSHGRRLTMVAALVTLNRQGLVTDQEEAILSAALRVLDEHHSPGDATLRNLIAVIEDGPAPLRLVALARDQDDRYRAAVDPLEASLIALCDGALGDTFAHKTSVPIDLEKPLCIDISGTGESDAKLTAAVLLACWSEGFAGLAAHHALADAGLEPQRRNFVVLDELWRVLRAGRGLVDRVDALTRLNRAQGVGMALVTHSLSDLIGLEDQADAIKAKGFADRAGFLVCAGLPSSEMAALEQVVGLSQRERQLITSWSTPPAWDPETGREMAPPGRGKVLIKVGGRPGIAVEVILTEAERRLHDTNQRWAS